MFGAGGYSSGLLFGGLMTGVGWRWTFLLPVPIALAALAAAFVLLPKDKPAEEGGHDLAGAALSTGAMLLLVYTVVTAPDVGWASARTDRLVRPGGRAGRGDSSSWRAGSSTR